MRKMGIASILVLAFAGTAFAEGPEGGQPPPPQDPAMQQPPPPGYGQPPPGQGQQPGGVQVVEQQQQLPPDQRPSRGLEYGAHLIVPVWLNGDLNLDPGIGIQGRVGWEFGNLTTELNIGIMVNGQTVEFSGFDSISTSLTNVWVGAGARYSFFNPSALVPFVGAGLALNFWGQQTCSDIDGTCSDSGERSATLSFNGLVGGAYEISENIAIEVGLQLNYTLPGDVFKDAMGEPAGYAWLSPFAGGSLYF